MSIAVIDYGLGNLRSVAKALEASGAKIALTNDPAKISKAKAIVFPGVGAFKKGMDNLNELKILPVLLKSIEAGVPFLGLCLGLQLLFSESEEYGNHKGFGIIKGKVKRFEPKLNPALSQELTVLRKGGVKVPHMGWNQVKQSAAHSPQSTDLFKGIPDNSYFYFVHSYYVEPEDKNIIIGTTDYGIKFASAINKDNIWGLQFHPEKSSAIGLKVLENFVKYVK